MGLRALMSASGIQRALVMLLAWVCLHSFALAQEFPAKPLRFMIGFGPGGSTDATSRLFAQKLSERLGQPVVPDLRTGATGSIAADVVAKAPPDGHTLIMITGAHPVVGAMWRKPMHHPVNDFAMVSTVVAYPVVLSVAANSPIATLDDLLARAKSRKHAISFGSAGVGSGQHLIGEWIGAEAGVELLHVPFKGNAAALTEMLTGRIDLLIDTLTSAYPHIRAGKVRALTVTTRERSSFLPDRPSISTVLPKVDFASWAGIATSPGTPVAVINRLNGEIRAILQMPEVQQRYTELGGVPMASTPDEMRARVETELARWNAVIDARGIERN